MNYNNQEGNNNGNFQPQMPNNNGYMNQGPMNQMPNNNGGYMNQGPMNQMPNNNGYMNQGPMNQMPNNNGYMNQPMPNNGGYMNQGPTKKGNKMFLIIGAALVVVVAVVLVFALGGKKTLSCTQNSGGASITFNFTFKKDEFKNGEVILQYSNLTQDEINSVKSTDLCSEFKSAFSYNIGKCDTKYTSNSLKVTAEINGGGTTGSMETMKSQLESQGFSCK